VRSGRWARNSRLNKERNLTLSAAQTSLSFAKERETSPCCPFPSTRRGTFWRKPKQGEVKKQA